MGHITETAGSSSLTNILLCSDVFALDMGDSVSVYLIAEEVIGLSGLESDKDPKVDGRKAL